MSGYVTAYLRNELHITTSYSLLTVYSYGLPKLMPTAPATRNICQQDACVIAYIKNQLGITTRIMQSTSGIRLPIVPTDAQLFLQ